MHIQEEAIIPIEAYRFFNQQEAMAVQQEEGLLDLQVGGYAPDDGLEGPKMFDCLTLPQIKLERLALELNQLE